MKAIWNNQIIAESDQTVVVEGNHYFPLESVKPEVLKPSSTTSSCPWKGVASYYSLEVEGKQGRGVVLPRPKGRGQEHNGPACLLEGCQGRVGFFRN